MGNSVITFDGRNSNKKIITSKGKRHVQNFSDLIFPFRFTISLIARDKCVPVHDWAFAHAEGLACSRLYFS